MADVTIAEGEIGAYEKTLVANTVYTVEFADDLDAVEILSDGTAPVAVTVDRAVPASVTDPAAWYLPDSGPGKRVIPTNRTGGGTSVHLRSTGTPTISVSRAR